MMMKATRAPYTLEFKQEAVRLVESGQSIAAASRTLGLVEQTLFNWVKAHREGALKGADNRSKVTAEQMEISRLRADLARVTMERDISGKAMAYCAACSGSMWLATTSTSFAACISPGVAEALVVHIRAVFTANRGAYGWPRIWRELSARGVRVGKRRVQRLMQQHGIRAVADGVSAS